MSRIDIPNFGELLGPHLSGVSQGAYPYLLSQLERTAAMRYRDWAEALPEHRKGLLQCAAREDEIADKVAAMFPPTAAQAAEVDAVMPKAKETYYSAFAEYTPLEQMTIQADAEKQGAGAWQNMKAAYPELSAQLDKLSAIELCSAAYLDEVLGGLVEA